MDAPNLFDPLWDFEGSREGGATTRAVRLGAQAGAERLGATLYELESGAMASPLHFHHGAEEMLFVIAGEPTLRTGTGEDDERTLAGEVVSFPPEYGPPLQGRPRHRLSFPEQAGQGRRERGVLCTRATEDAEMRRYGKLRTSRSGPGRWR